MIASTAHMVSATFLLVVTCTCSPVVVSHILMSLTSSTALTIASNTLLCVPRASLDPVEEARLANISASGARRPLVLALTALAVIGQVFAVILGPVDYRPQWISMAVFAALFLCWSFWVPWLEVGSVQERLPLVPRPSEVEGEATELQNEERFFKHWRRWVGIVLLLLADSCIFMGIM